MLVRLDEDFRVTHLMIDTVRGGDDVKERFWRLEIWDGQGKSVYKLDRVGNRVPKYLTLPFR